ncbi:MAG: hypothetical protein ACJAYO_001318, partial [Thalassolituus oleivorans]
KDGKTRPLTDERWFSKQKGFNKIKKAPNGSGL